MENKSFAVIIPNYNKSHYIQETLDSILAQSLIPNEIIIVDDCSSDCSKNIALDYQEKHPDLIKVYCLKDNKGVQYARNYGVKKACSEYITFIDSDDYYYDNNYFSSIIPKVNKNKVVYKTYCFYDNNKKDYIFPIYKKKYRSFYKHNALYCYVNFKNMQYWPFAFVVSKKIFMDVGGYNFPLNYYEDLDLLIRYSIYGLKPKCLKGYGMAIRKNANDISHLSSQSELFESAKYVILERYNKLVPSRSFVNDRLFNFFEIIISISRRILSKLFK